MSNDKYELLAQQLQALIEGEPDLIANLSNASAAINEAFRESLPAYAFHLEKVYAEQQQKRMRHSL